MPWGIRGHIIFVEVPLADGQERRETNVGYISAYYVPVSDTLEDGTGVFDMFDAISGEMEECYHALFDENELKQDMIDEQFSGDVMTMDVLYLDRMEILPAHRGRSLGLAVIRKMIERFAPHTGFVAMIPFPIRSSQTEQWGEQMEMHRFDRD